MGILSVKNPYQKFSCVRYRPKFDARVIPLVDLMICVFASSRKILMASLKYLSVQPSFHLWDCELLEYWLIFQQFATPQVDRRMDTKFI